MSENRETRLLQWDDVRSMDMDRTACYRAISTRDARFDGRLFIAVKTTGISCRPICPARIPKLENVSFYPSAAAAQEVGFRPCLRCCSCSGDRRRRCGVSATRRNAKQARCRFVSRNRPP